MFETNKRKFYKQIDQLDQSKQTLPNVEESKLETQEDLVTTVAKIRKKLPNWKAPGPDNLQGFWLKNLKLMHGRIASQLQDCLNEGRVPEWVVLGRTTLVIKDSDKGNVA